MNAMIRNDTWEVCCPKCGKAGKVRVAIEVWALFTVDGTEIDGQDHEWGAESKCDCGECGYEGLAREFAKPLDEKEIHETDRRYRVTIEETIIHEIEVAAVSEGAAAVAAKKQFVADHPDHHDFDVADVEEIESDNP